MARVYIFRAVLHDIVASTQCCPRLVRIEEKEIVTLDSYKVVRGGWAAAAAVSQELLSRYILGAAYPAIPTD